MNEQTKYFGMSAGLHGFLFILLIGLSAAAGKSPRVVTIDFSLNESLPLCAPAQPKTAQPVVPSRPHAAPDTPRTVEEAPVPPVPAISSIPARVEPMAQTVPVVAQPEPQLSGQRLEKAAAGTPQSVVSAIRPVTPSTGVNQAGDNSIEQVRRKYLKEHFSYIRDLIVKRLDYPPVARRMEWSGKVVVAFVVAESGDVRSVHVKESSGYPLLDHSAVDTVKRVAPFPRPPVAAEIVMPVQFRLE